MDAYSPDAYTSKVAPLSPEDDRLASVQLSTRSLDGRKRQVKASLVVPVEATTLWGVLTDYEGLADFIPNLWVSRRLPHPQGGIRLEQIGGQRILALNFSARVVLDMEEDFPHRITFTIVEGDFKEFSGYWQLTPLGIDPQWTELTYFLEVRPKLTMPVKILECRLNMDLPRNLVAIAQRSQGMI
ncbi:MAG: SRPBCC family protein [Prochlorotrichaceae cyanobacterium]